MPFLRSSERTRDRLLGPGQAPGGDDELGRAEDIDQRRSCPNHREVSGREADQGCDPSCRRMVEGARPLR